MSNGVYKFTLDKPYLGFSNRFTRRFGSGSFLRIRISSDLIYNKRTQADLVALFKRPLVIFTKVFRAFYAKDQSVFYFSTNETYNRPDVVPSERGLSLAQFLAWHNDIVINSSQVNIFLR